MASCLLFQAAGMLPTMATPGGNRPFAYTRQIIQSCQRRARSRRSEQLPNLTAPALPYDAVRTHNRIADSHGGGHHMSYQQQGPRGDGRGSRPRSSQGGRGRGAGLAPPSTETASPAPAAPASVSTSPAAPTTAPPASRRNNPGRLRSGKGNGGYPLRSRNINFTWKARPGPRRRRPPDLPGRRSGARPGDRPRPGSLQLRARLLPGRGPAAGGVPEPG